MELNPELADAWTTLGTVYAWGLKQRDAAEAFGKSLEIAPRQPRVLLSLGHVRKTLGETEASVRAYRDGLAMEPRLGEAWWSLADLKTQAFSDADVEAMQETMGDEGVPERERAALRFALGKAFEDRGDVEAAFEHYRTGNAIRHRHERFNVERFERQCDALRETFTAETLEARRAALVEGPIPIFVIGLPRSGSTLVDQILSSHSAVQGTMELPHILGYVRELDPRGAGRGGATRLACTRCPRSVSRTWAAATWTRPSPTTAARRTSWTRLPNNFMHVGLIARMLPDAVFVDTRRHPLGCCFSIYKQNFARGQTFGYDLGTLAAYYRNYVDVMAHWDAVLPGRVHRVVYERLVDDTESETRRLLAHCGLPFEEACLRFHETERVVRTASAEQVRQPIYRDAKTHWQAYEAHLGPLKAGARGRYSKRGTRNPRRRRGRPCGVPSRNRAPTTTGGDKPRPYSVAVSVKISGIMSPGNGSRHSPSSPRTIPGNCRYIVTGCSSNEVSRNPASSSAPSISGEAVLPLPRGALDDVLAGVGRRVAGIHRAGGVREVAVRDRAGPRERRHDWFRRRPARAGGPPAGRRVRRVSGGAPRPPPTGRDRAARRARPWPCRRHRTVRRGPRAGHTRSPG